MVPDSEFTKPILMDEPDVSTQVPDESLAPAELAAVLSTCAPQAVNATRPRGYECHGSELS